MASKVPCPARYIDGRSGSQILLDPDDFPMVYHKTEAKRKYFYCRKKKELGCKVAVSVDLQTDMIVRHNGVEHNHDSQVCERAVKEIVKDHVASAAKNVDKNPRSVFQDISSEVLNTRGLKTCSSLLPTSKAVARMVQKQRQNVQKFPQLPTTFDFPMPLEFTTTMDGLQYLILDEQVPARVTRVLGFCSPTGITMIKNAGDLFCDGTFEIAESTLFTQVWVVSVKVENKLSLPAMFFILPSKEKPVYKMVFEKIRELLGDSEVQKFHLDFESATLSACKSVFPDSEIQGCNVHWKRCLRRKLDDLGLKMCTQKDPEVQSFVRWCWAMSMIPEAEVDNCFQWIQENAPYEEEDMEDEEDQERAAMYNENLAAFVSYFESNFIGVPQNTRGPGGRRKPRFVYDYWSCYNSIITGHELTTNVAETWNSVNKLSTVAKPNLWSLIKMFQKEEAAARAKYSSVMASRWVDSSHGRTARRYERKQRLKELVERFARMNIKDYMESVASYYNDD